MCRGVGEGTSLFQTFLVSLGILIYLEEALTKAEPFSHPWLHSQGWLPNSAIVSLFPNPRTLLNGKDSSKEDQRIDQTITCFYTPARQLILHEDGLKSWVSSTYHRQCSIKLCRNCTYLLLLIRLSRFPPLDRRVYISCLNDCLWYQLLDPEKLLVWSKVCSQTGMRTRGILPWVSECFRVGTEEPTSEITQVLVHFFWPSSPWRFCAEMWKVGLVLFSFR